MDYVAGRMDELRQEGWSEDDLSRIEKHARKYDASDAEFFEDNHGPGEGKSTAADAAAKPSQNDSICERKHEGLRKHASTLETMGVDFIHIIGFDVLADSGRDDQDLPEEAEIAKRNSDLKQIETDLEKLGREAVKAIHQDSPIVEYYEKQIERLQEGGRVVLCTPKMFHLVDEILDVGRVFLDEGIEGEVSKTTMSLSSKRMLDRNGVSFGELENRFQVIDIFHLEEVWEMYEDYFWHLKERSKNYYHTQQGAVTSLDPGDWENYSNVVGAEKCYQHLFRRGQGYGDVKSGWELEIREQARRGNERILQAMKKIERRLKFFYKAMRQKRVVGYEQDGKPVVEVRRLEAYEFQFKNCQKIILNAEGSDWMDTFIEVNEFDIEHERYGKNKGLECEKYLCRRIDGKDFKKRTVPRDRIDNQKLERLYRWINLLHESGHSVGVVSYKELIERRDYLAEDIVKSYWFNSEGINDMRDCDLLFLIGSPRPNSISFALRFFDLYGKFPDKEWDSMVEGDDLGDWSGFDDESMHLIWEMEVERRIRDAGGRLRGEGRIFAFTIPGLIDWDKELRGWKEISWEVAKLYGPEEFAELDVSPEPRNIKMMTNEGNVSIGLLAEKLCGEELNLSQLAERLQKAGIRKSEAEVESALVSSGLWRKASKNRFIWDN